MTTGPPASPRVVVVHEDDALVAFDKPPGTCVIPARHGARDDCLRAAAEAALGRRLWVVHRIDRETSGVVVMAKSPEAHRVLNDAFAARGVVKTYRALVAAHPPDVAGVVDVPLHAARRGRMRPALAGEHGIPARTRYRVVDPEPATAVLVDFEPETGRQHQIRVHARSLGCPILGDRLYAPRVVRERAPRLMLHAYQLVVPSPLHGGNVVIAASLPPEFDSVRQRLADA